VVVRGASAPAGSVRLVPPAAKLARVASRQPSGDVYRICGGYV